MPASKVCSACRLDKFLADFHRDNRARGERPARSGRGVGATCKACRSHLRNPSLLNTREAQAQLVPGGTKRCNTCQTVKPLAGFHVRRASVDGWAYTCRACVNARSERWKLAHPRAAAEWYEQNREHKRQYWAEWRARNADRHKENYRRWAKANPDRINALVARRNAAKLQATPKWANPAAIRAFYREALRLTRETGIRHEVDHIIPLRSRVVCGLHVETNLQILTTIENKKKSNYLPPELGPHGLLVHRHP